MKLEKIESLCEKIPFSGCWIWMGLVSPDGYAIVCRLRVHREAWRRANGEIPPRSHVLHACDIPCCVNPQHLYLGTPADNARDRIVRGRGAAGEKHGQTSLTEAEVRQIRDLKGRFTQVEIGDFYSVSGVTVNNIHHRITWKYLP